MAAQGQRTPFTRRSLITLTRLDYEGRLLILINNACVHTYYNVLGERDTAARTI